MDLLSNQPLEILDAICYHVPNRELKHLACMNEPLFIAATRTIWSRNSVCLRDRDHKDPQRYLPPEYRYDKPSIGEWEHVSHDELSRAKAAHRHDKMTRITIAEHDSGRKDSDHPEEVERSQNVNKTARQKEVIQLVGPCAAATHDRRVLYARQTRRLQVSNFGVGARHTRGLIALLSKVGFPGLHDLVIVIAFEDTKPRAPRLIQLHVAKLVFGTMTWTTKNLEICFMSNGLNLLYTIFSVSPRC